MATKKLDKRKGLDEADEENDDDTEDELGFSRNYFLAKETVATGSSRKRSTFPKLSDIALVDPQVLREAISNIPPKHEKEIEALQASYKDQYSTWLFELRGGFSLLMYGFGSKKVLLEDFASTTLQAYNVVVVNGYLPSVSLKQVMTTMVELLLGDQSKNPIGSKPKARPCRSHSADDSLSILNGLNSNDCDDFVCLLIHNIDGPALRDPESQRYLAQVCCCSRVRMIASIDHINAPLLWDKKMAYTQFKWCWYHVPTFVSYSMEGIFFPLILADSGNTQTQRTALVVLQSLTPNAQSIFRILAEHQLANPKEAGMHVSMLYSKCRERFLVSSQVTLNSHLTEFKDHDLVKVRKHADGQECLHIPLPFDALQKLLHEL